MPLTVDDFFYLGMILEGFFFGEISVSTTVMKFFLKSSIPGVYSGIFALHMKCHTSRNEIDNAKQNIVFYALGVLYVFSVAVIILDAGGFVVESVSNNAAFFFKLCANQLCAQTNDVSLLLHMSIAQVVFFGCCDFLTQCILVRTTDNGYRFHLFISSSKIHRCWIVWGCDIRVVIVPCIFAFAYLGWSISLD